MSGLDLNALNQAEQELKSRQGGGKLFVRLDKGEQKDIRILEPTPAMNGLYWIEVPTWWIDGKPIVSPEVIGEPDIVQEIIDEFKADFGKTTEGAAEFKKLMEAAKGPGQELVKKQTAFWVPILEFEFKLGKNDRIEGVEDTDGNYDPDKIKEFIKDGEAKVLDCKQSLLTSINRQITTGRAGANFLDKDKGYNLIIERQGEGRDTRYTGVKDEQMPMPAEFYGAGTIDLYKVAKSQLVTEAYIEAILANYFDGDPKPDKPEYRFPDLRKALQGGEEAAEESSTRSRRRDKTDKAKADSTEEKAEPATRRNRAKGETAEPAEGTRRRRNIVEDAASD